MRGAHCPDSALPGLRATLIVLIARYLDFVQRSLSWYRVTWTSCNSHCPDSALPGLRATLIVLIARYLDFVQLSLSW